MLLLGFNNDDGGGGGDEDDDDEERPGLLSSQLPIRPSTSYSSIAERARRSHQRIFLSSAAVTNRLGSAVQRIDFMVEVCAPGPISYDGGLAEELLLISLLLFVLLEMLLSVVVLVPVDAAVVVFPLLRERSNIRSFFSAPPVASIWGRGWSGKATARTIWLCWSVWRISPVCVSQMFLSYFLMNKHVILAHPLPQIRDSRWDQ